MKDYAETVFNGCKFYKEVLPRINKNGYNIRYALWNCICGRKFTASIGNVSSGQVKSCGCKKIAATKAFFTKHGHSSAVGASKLYRFWQSMKDRCLNKKSTSYKNYGGRGIKMYEKWQTSFISFEKWFVVYFKLPDIPKNKSMDRINNEGHYYPSNLRLATPREQANNKRNNHFVIFKGQKMTIAELSRKTGVKAATISARLIKKLKPEDILK